MLYFFRLLLLLINIDQETVLNWFGIENARNQAFNQSNFETSTDVSLTTFRLILENLWKKVQDGLNIGDIENILFFILFIRFVILAIRYNLKTSVYITCIGLFAGYLWYRHLVDVLSMYRMMLLKVPFLHKFAEDAIGIRLENRRTTSGVFLPALKKMGKTFDPTIPIPMVTEAEGKFRDSVILNPITANPMIADTDTDTNLLKLKENVHWYNPGKVLYYAITKGIVNVDSELGGKYYIDPLSMIISKLPESIKLNIVPIYYKLYLKIIPTIYGVLSKFWRQLSGVIGYAFITRIGKRYCPYLVRWHWTLLLVIGILEKFILMFVYRVYYFKTFVLTPRSQGNPEILFQVNILGGLISFIVLIHIGFIIFGLVHAIWGQYFYVPFFVENTELHIGLRPTDSVYSGGKTAWQNKEEKEKNLNRFFPKIWYGWFGRGTKNDLQLTTNIRKFLKKMIKKLRRQFQR